MKIIELIPENWNFAIGRQNTVRKGFKWADVTPGEQLQFQCDEGGDTYRFKNTTVLRVTKTTFDQLTDDECSRNHKYKGRDDLLGALERAYGDFKATDDVTLIEFHPA